MQEVHILCWKVASSNTLNIVLKTEVSLKFKEEQRYAVVNVGYNLLKFMFFILMHILLFRPNLTCPRTTSSSVQGTI